jgi:hypothetical protein
VLISWGSGELGRIFKLIASEILKNHALLVETTVAISEIFKY